MLRRASYNKYIATNANEEDGVEDLNLVVDVEGGNEDAPAVAVAQVISAATASISEEEEDGLTWTDDYFADRTDVVAAFDFNQDEYARSKIERACWMSWISRAVLCSLVVRIFVVPGLVNVVLFYCWLFFMLIFAKHQQEKVWIPHLAVTTTGVRYVEPPEKESRFLGSTVHIPWENIEAVEITSNEAASVGMRTSSLDWSDYVVHGCAPRGLHKIRRYIVEDGRDCDGTRLDIRYLLEPYRFKKLVMSLKQQQQQEAKLDKKEEEFDIAVV